MTTVIINAISVREGGSLVVLQNLLAGMVHLRPEWQWHVATNSEARARLPDLHNTAFHVFPEHVYAGWKVRLWYETGLPRLVKQVKADLLFSHTNYLPMRRLPCPTLLLVQHAGHFSEVFKRLTEVQLASLLARQIWRLKGCWVKSSVRRAQCVIVQTAALARRITEETGVPHERLSVIPHGIGQAVLHERLLPPPTAGQLVRIGYITKYGVQKNFTVLFAAAAQLQSLGIKLVLVLTLAPYVPENQAVFELARRYGISELIENHGELSAPEIDALYRSLHLFVFPSLCESFGFPMVEALAHALPLLVADTDSNIEVAGKAGLTFAPDNVPALAALIHKLIEDPAWHQTCTRASQERAAHFTWHKAAAATLERMDRMLDASRLTTTSALHNMNNGHLEKLTKAHYNDFPLDFLTEEDERNIEHLQPVPFLRFVDRYLKPGARVAEIGCGPGRATLFMTRRGMDLLAVDISLGSLRLARRRAPESEFVLASNLNLPLSDGAFDAVVSDGVIHHTPDAYRSFCENARILRPGGVMYVGVYRRKRYYYYVYTYLGRPIRWLEKSKCGKALIYGTLLPVYYAAHLVKSGGKRTWHGAKNFFYDYIITPQATFHTREEITEWGRRNGLELIEYDENVGNVHAFVFSKTAPDARA